MLLNYVKLAIRLLLKNPFFTFVNVVGLSIGFTTFFVLWQYSASELTTDQHHKDFDHIARVGFHMRSSVGGDEHNLSFGLSQATLLPMIQEDLPEVQSYTRISEQGGFFQNDLHGDHGTRIVITYRNSRGEEQTFKETNIAYADRNLFEFFTIPLISGDPKSVLAGVNFVAVSRSTAEKYFGKVNPLGKQLVLNDHIVLQVTGVYENVAASTQINYDMIISNERLLKKWSSVYWGLTRNFVKLKHPSFKDFEDRVNLNKEKYFGKIQNENNNIVGFVQPLKEMSFSRGFIGDENFPQKSKTLLIILGSIAVIVLGMAWINFINLSISRLARRMKEFAARKVNGASGVDLMLQFLTEATLINILAATVSLTVVQLIRVPLNTLFQIHIAEIWLTEMDVWVVVLGAIGTGILVTGLYPAIMCIKRQPNNIFIAKGNSTRSAFVSSTLTTFQFTAATVLIIWALVVYRQLDYILNKETGFKRDNIIILESPITKPNNYEQQLEIFLREVKNLSLVNNATFSSYAIGAAGNKPGGITRMGWTHTAGTDCNAVDENFIPLFGLKLVAGRNFLKDDTPNAVIVSRRIATQLGFNNPNDAVGTMATANTGDWNVKKDVEIIGVIEDYRRFSFFNFSESNATLARGGDGIFLTYKNGLFPNLSADYIAINIPMANFDQAVASIESVYKENFPGNILDSRLLDDQINQTYLYEKVTRNQILMFTLLAIGIACMGLTAMMNQKVLDKTKEIGIRKILGAGTGQIGQLLIHSTLRQLVAASALGIPIGYYLGSEYLQKYAERITLSLWYFLLPISILITIMLATVIAQIWKAIKTNPVESLRYE